MGEGCNDEHVGQGLKVLGGGGKTYTKEEEDGDEENESGRVKRRSEGQR